MDPKRIEAIVAAHRQRPGATLPILHAIQDELGYVPEEAISIIALGLNLSRAEVHGVISYYHHFRQIPPGRHVVKLCRAEACQAVGGGALAEHARQSLGCGFHETTADGAFSLEPVYCLGLCACGPSLQVDDTELHGRMTPEKFDTLMGELEGER